MTENKVWMNKRSIQQYLFLYYNIYICCWVLQYFKKTNKQQYTNLVTINNWLSVLYANYNSNNMKKYGKANFKLPFRYNANPKSTPPPKKNLFLNLIRLHWNVQKTISQNQWSRNMWYELIISMRLWQFSFYSITINIQDIITCVN